ncbi:MAG TPA: L-fucose:H+ symporter permease [Cytophagaceae bacterium]|jgi:FHS family L-fucose permease-like MFS transporter
MASTGTIPTESSYEYDTSINYTRPMSIVVSLFFMWAVAVNINDILIPHLKKACGLTDFQSSFIPFVFFGGYFIMARFSGLIIKKLGYKKGLIVGLILCASGAFLFYPAAQMLSFPMFLVAIFVMACGNSTLEVGAYPLGASLGHPAKASARLNLASAFNALGAVLTSLAARSFILSGMQRTEAQLASMSTSDLNAYRVAEASTVKTPYIILGIVFLVIAVILYLVNIQEAKEQTIENEGYTTETKKSGLFDYPQLVLGVLAIFFYVGAQVGVASFIFRYTEFRIAGIPEKTAALFITYHLIAFMVGRFVGTALQQKIKPNYLLAIFASANLLLVLVAILGTGNIGVRAVIGIGFFHSIMFPTIFALALRGLGSFTKDGSTYLVMAIVGGAVIPLVMGYISDVSNILVAFTVPALCYLFIIYYALRGYRTQVKL